MMFSVTRNMALMAGSFVLVVAAPAQASWIPTNFGIGADAEVRESNPTQNRGSSTELATRIRNAFPAGDPNDGTDRGSAFYTKFDLSGIALAPSYDTAFRLTYRNNNLSANRIEDTVTPDPNVRTGLAIYGLDPTAAGASWNENTITYLNAPGMTPDGNVGTRDFNTDATLLGTIEFPAVGPAGHLLVGDELIFQSALLDQFILDVISQGFGELTLMAATIHDGSVGISDWLNFNYLFNPKEQTMLNIDPSSPWSGADNASGAFSPSLFVAAVPEPAALALFGLGLVGFGVVACRRKTR